MTQRRQRILRQDGGSSPITPRYLRAHSPPVDPGRHSPCRPSPLAGCTGTSDGDASASADALCAAAAPSGDASDAVTVDGEAGQISTATFDAGLTIEELERTVVSDGDGEALQEGDLVEYALSAFSADTAEKVGDIGYVDGEVLPTTIAAESNLGQIMGCANVGSRLVVTFPASESAGAEVYIVDVLGVTPTAAWGEEETPADGLPRSSSARAACPRWRSPTPRPPAEVELGVLKRGDGEVVESGDNVLVQYHGVKWSDGEVFDSSWDRGTPAASRRRASWTASARRWRARRSDPRSSSSCRRPRATAPPRSARAAERDARLRRRHPRHAARRRRAPPASPGALARLTGCAASSSSDPPVRSVPRPSR